MTLEGGAVTIGSGGNAAQEGRKDGFIARVDAWKNSSCDASDACHSKPPAACDDQDPCTVDLCASNGSCKHLAAEGLLCKAADGCVAEYRCETGKCAPFGPQRLWTKTYEHGVLPAHTWFVGGDAARVLNDDRISVGVQTVDVLNKYVTRYSWGAAHFDATGKLQKVGTSKLIDCSHNCSSLSTPGAAVSASGTTIVYGGESGFHHPAWRGAVSASLAAIDITQGMHGAKFGGGYFRDAAAHASGVVVLTGERDGKYGAPNTPTGWVRMIVTSEGHNTSWSSYIQRNGGRLAGVSDIGHLFTTVAGVGSPILQFSSLGAHTPVRSYPITSDESVASLAALSDGSVGVVTVSCQGANCQKRHARSLRLATDKTAVLFSRRLYERDKDKGPLMERIAGTPTHKVMGALPQREWLVGGTRSLDGATYPWFARMSPDATAIREVTLKVGVQGAMTSRPSQFSNGDLLIQGNVNLPGAKSGIFLARVGPFGHPTCEAAGKCAGLARADCDDNDACTVDDCDAEKGCVHPPSGWCEDGNPCTTRSVHEWRVRRGQGQQLRRRQGLHHRHLRPGQGMRARHGGVRVVASQPASSCAAKTPL